MGWHDDLANSLAKQFLLDELQELHSWITRLVFKRLNHIPILLCQASDVEIRSRKQNLQVAFKTKRN